MNWLALTILLIAAALLAYSLGSPNKYRAIVGIPLFLVVVGTASYNRHTPDATYWAVAANVVALIAGTFIGYKFRLYWDKSRRNAVTD